MRKRRLWHSPPVRFSLLLLMMMVAGFSALSCGGGGGSSSPATVTGKVVDSTGAAIQGATITIVGTRLTGQTDASGAFTITNVPLSATRFLVTSPDLGKYLNFSQYQGKTYETDNAGQPCRLPLPALTSGAVVSLPGMVTLLSAATPPPPPTGCPV